MHQNPYSNSNAFHDHHGSFIERDVNSPDYHDMRPMQAPPSPYVRQPQHHEQQVHQRIGFPPQPSFSQLPPLTHQLRSPHVQLPKQHTQQVRHSTGSGFRVQQSSAQSPLSTQQLDVRAYQHRMKQLALQRRSQQAHKSDDQSRLALVQSTMTQQTPSSSLMQSPQQPLHHQTEQAAHLPIGDAEQSQLPPLTTPHRPSFHALAQTPIPQSQKVERPQQAPVMPLLLSKQRRSLPPYRPEPNPNTPKSRKRPPPPPPAPALDGPFDQPEAQQKQQPAQPTTPQSSTSYPLPSQHAHSAPAKNFQVQQPSMQQKQSQQPLLPQQRVFVRRVVEEETTVRPRNVVQAARKSGMDRASENQIMDSEMSLRDKMAKIQSFSEPRLQLMLTPPKSPVLQYSLREAILQQHQQPARHLLPLEMSQQQPQTSKQPESPELQQPIVPPQPTPRTSLAKPVPKPRTIFGKLVLKRTVTTEVVKFVQQPPQRISAAKAEKKIQAASEKREKKEESVPSKRRRMSAASDENKNATATTGDSKMKSDAMIEQPANEQDEQPGPAKSSPELIPPLGSVVKAKRGRPRKSMGSNIDPAAAAEQDENIDPKAEPGAVVEPVVKAKRGRPRKSKAGDAETAEEQAANIVLKAESVVRKRRAASILPTESKKAKTDKRKSAPAAVLAAKPSDPSFDRRLQLYTDEDGEVYKEFPQLAENTNLMLSDYAALIGKSREEVLEMNNQLWNSLGKIKDHTTERDLLACNEKLTEGDDSDHANLLYLVAHLNGSKRNATLNRVTRVYSMLDASTPEDAISHLHGKFMNMPLVFTCGTDRSKYYISLDLKAIPVEGGLRVAMLSLMAAIRLFNISIDTQVGDVVRFFYTAAGLELPNIRVAVNKALEIVRD